MLFLQLNCAILLAQNKITNSRVQISNCKLEEKSENRNLEYEKLYRLYCQRI